VTVQDATAGRISLRLTAARSHAGARVFSIMTAAETIGLMDQHQADLIVVDLHDAGRAFTSRLSSLHLLQRVLPEATSNRILATEFTRCLVRSLATKN
jgi:hypothetical protein